MARAMRCALTVACLAVALSAFAAERCELVIDDLSGVATWPLVGGLALPEGLITDPANIRVLDAEGAEVPCQADLATTYRDGSVRWALISMVGSPAGTYTAEFGPDVTRAPVEGVTVTREQGGFRVDTGAAQFLVTPGNLLIESAHLAGDRELWATGECYAYLVDNQGRRATCDGPAAEIELTTLKSGPMRVVLRTEGWYVTDDGQRLARGVARMSFFAGATSVKLSHSIIFTEDTNELWLRDYGVRIPLAGDTPATATFDTDRAFDDTVSSVQIPADTFPHFAETASEFTLALGAEEVTRGAACGEWVDLTRGDAGISVAVRDFAEQFPKELAADTDGITVHLWPESSGRELDFRAETLARDYWQSWADIAPGGAEKLAQYPSNAQSCSKTHELWIMPHAGDLDLAATARAAHAVCRPVLMLSDAAQTCASGAIPWPLQPADPERFPDEERMIADFWERLVYPYEVFPMTGAIGWGVNPYLRYIKRDGVWFADFYRISGIVEYGMRRHVWSLFARSGDRRYYEWATRFNAHTADFEMHHWDAGERYRGGMASQRNIHMPFPWGERSNSLSTGVSGSDIRNFMLEYYMTGNERALEASIEFGDSLKAHWDLPTARGGSAPFLTLRLLTGLYTREWDEDFHAMARELAELIIDMDNANGLTNEMPYGCLYKVDRNASALYDYWWATGEELPKQAFLKALDFEYRFNRIPVSIAYQNGKAYLYTIAYQMTGREEYRRIATQLVRSGLAMEPVTIAEEIGDTPPQDLDRLPFRGPHLNMHPTLGMPTALSLLARAEEPIPPYPMLIKAFTAETAYAIFDKPAGEEVTMRLFMRTLRQGDVTPTIFDPADEPIDAAIEMLERPTFSQTIDPTTDIGPTGFRRFSIDLRIPADAPAGEYLVDVGGPEEFIVLQSSVPNISLVCPDGFWVGGGGLSGSLPMYFNVPEGREHLELFVGRPLTIVAPDGSVALEPTDGNIGQIAIPVLGRFGVWSAQSALPGHVRLLNTPGIVACGKPDRLVSSLGLLPELRPLPPPADERFVSGMISDALQLTGDQTISFPRGAVLEDGSYEHFPATEGTIELWFCPNWSSSDLTFTPRQTVKRRFVDGGPISFYYRYGNSPVTSNLYSYVDLLTLGELGKPGATSTGNIGGHARWFMQSGDWTHLAATWQLTEGPRGTEGQFRVYVNGQFIEPTWNYPRNLDGRKPYVLREVAEKIGIGPLNGSIDELRVSNVVRYRESFEPPVEALQSDANTLALFHFDGTEEGISGEFSELIPTAQ